MRGTVAKKLRRAAQDATVGLPTRQLLINTKTGLIFNNPRTTRAAYRQLKRNNRRS
ncbi:MAG: hypothetical protein KBG29_01860 [Pseudomonadales bacterium]|nr:hypothetical protein [Pseudomonadales bacterium]